MTSQNTLPKVAVLLATFNGMPWLPEQLRSIQNQLGVDLHIYISDDGSTDQTVNWIKKQTVVDSRITLLDKPAFAGSAGQNFYRLLKDVEISIYDYVAFSDQDDIWNVNKLSNHIELAEQSCADGISSNVIAFWENGDKKQIIKSQPQKKWDYLFESAGPGCTFLITPWLASKVREQLNSNSPSPAREVVLHDWLTYAVCRAHGRKWVIDSTPSILYRQHDSNVVGANVGLKAKYSRFKRLKQGWYRQEVAKISATCALISNEAEMKNINQLLTQKSFKSQLELLTFIPHARRNFIDRLVLFGLVLSFLF